MARRKKAKKHTEVIMLRTTSVLKTSFDETLADDESRAEVLRGLMEKRVEEYKEKEKE